jgi:hypothetical protein
MDRAEQWINDIENKLRIVNSWLIDKEDFFPLSISADKLKSQEGGLETCEALIRQLLTQAQLYGLEDEAAGKLSFIEGAAKNLRAHLTKLEGEAHSGFFDKSIRQTSTIINGISIIVSIHQSRQFTISGDGEM